MSGLEWGDVATWSSSGVALVALLFAGSAWRREAGRDKRLAQDRDSAQASLVAAWEESEFHGTLTVRIRNTSTLPVYRVRLTTLGADEDGMYPEMKNVYVGLLGPSSDRVVEIESGDLLTLEFTDASRAGWSRTDERLVREADRDRGVRADLRAMLLIPERTWATRARGPWWREALRRQGNLARRRQRRIDKSRLARWMRREDPWR